MSTLPHGRSRYRHHGCRCDVCIEANRLYMRGLRARKRGLAPVPSPPAEAETASTASAEAPGPVVAAVQADLAGLGELRGYQSLAAAAAAMGRILDDHRLATTAPAAAKSWRGAGDLVRGDDAVSTHHVTPSCGW